MLLLTQRTYYWQVGLSIGTRTRPTWGKPFDPYPKPIDPTPVTIGNEPQPPETETGGLVDGFALQNPIPTNPTTYILETLTDFLKYVDFRSFLDRSVPDIRVTWTDSSYGRRWVWMLETQRGWVDFGVGTYLTWTDPWTSLLTSGHGLGQTLLLVGKMT